MFLNSQHDNLFGPSGSLFIIIIFGPIEREKNVFFLSLGEDKYIVFNLFVIIVDSSNLQIVYIYSFKPIYIFYYWQKLANVNVIHGFWQF